MKFTSIDLDAVRDALVPATTIAGECGARVGNTTCGKKTLKAYWDEGRGIQGDYVWLCEAHEKNDYPDF